MTFLTMTQDVIAELNLSIPGSVTANDDVTKQVTRLINKEGKILARMQSATGGGWPILERRNPFDTVVSQGEYPLPVDFAKILTMTPWNRSQTLQLVGPFTPGEWQQLKSGLRTGTVYTSYRMQRSQSTPTKIFEVDPVPSSVQTLFFEYLSSHWAVDESGTNTSDTLTNDTDESLIDPLIVEMGAIWRFKMAKGEDYSADLAEYEIRRNESFGREFGPRILSITDSQIVGPFDGTVPETGIGQ